MSRWSISLIMSLVLASSAFSAAVPGDRPTAASSAERIYFGGAALGAKSDTLCVYGGPGVLDGKFETAGGLPDAQGWTGVDITAGADNAWSISTFRGDELDPLTTDNLAWWCGDVYISCGAGDPVEGYGNNYAESLEWWGDVPDPALSTTVRVTAVLNHDLELGYDFLRLQYEGAPGWTSVWDQGGAATSLAFDQSFSLDPADYAGDGADRIHLRWLVVSDGAWSDADCLYPTAGAAQIDLIGVSFDQGSGPVDMGLETCEAGDPRLWSPEETPYVGDFSKVWPQLASIDPCAGNTTPRFAFIDDGIVVPGTDGSYGITWTYGPGSFVVNSTGGLLTEDDHLQNQIWSPPIALPGGDYDGHLVSFDVWPHLPVSSGMFYTWDVGYSPDGEVWGGWQSRSFIYYGLDRHRRFDHYVSDMAPGDAQFVRVALGVYEAGWIWGIETNDVTPAPFFDNVAYRVFQREGPELYARAVDMAQDAFAQVLDPADPAAAAVRFDMAQLIDKAALTAGDSIAVSSEVMPFMHYRLMANPVFDPWRTSGLPEVGTVAGDSGPWADLWWFDLPDEGFLFPGDVLHYYFRAVEYVEGVPGVSILPADTTGYASGKALGAYDEVFTFRALPTVQHLSSLNQPGMLLWLDDADREAVAVWSDTVDRLFNMGMPVYDGDYYVANSASGAGLGTRASAASIAGYRAMIYDGGNGIEGLLVDSDDDVGTVDLDLLSAWLAAGNNGLVVMGDNVVSDLVNHSAAGAAFASNELGVGLVQADHYELLGGVRRPAVVMVDAPPYNSWEPAWVADGGCPTLNTFDLIEALSGTVRAAEWVAPGTYPYAALTYKAGSDWRGRLVLPYGMAAVSSDTDPVAARALLLRNFVEHYFTFVVPGVDDEPGLPPKALSVVNHPNPFNPRTTVAYGLPAAGRVIIEVFDARGAKVSSLLDEVRPAGRGDVVWEGRDDGGRSLGSGLYFAKVRAGGREALTRMILIR